MGIERRSVEEGNSKLPDLLENLYHGGILTLN